MADPVAATTNAVKGAFSKAASLVRPAAKLGFYALAIGAIGALVASGAGAVAAPGVGGAVAHAAQGLGITAQAVSGKISTVAGFVSTKLGAPAAIPG